MAFVDLVPANINMTVYQAASGATNSGVVNSLTGTPINLSAFTDLVATLTPLNVGPCASSVTFGTVTGGSTGILTVTTDDTDLATVAPGSANLQITGKPTSGDIVQILASGICTVIAT